MTGDATRVTLPADALAALGAGEVVEGEGEAAVATTLGGGGALVALGRAAMVAVAVAPWWTGDGVSRPKTSTTLAQVSREWVAAAVAAAGTVAAAHTCTVARAGVRGFWYRCNPPVEFPNLDDLSYQEALIGIMNKLDIDPQQMAPTLEELGVDRLQVGLTG